MNHDQLINLGQALGYSSISRKGLCNGFAYMWANAICANNLEGFNKRMELMERYKDNPQQLNIDINRIRSKNTGPEKQPLSEDDRDLLEIPAFFEGVLLYLHPEKFSDVFEKTLKQHDSIEVSKFVNSSQIESRGGIKAAFTVVDQYTQATLADFLEKLASKIEKHPNMAIVFASGAHAVSARVIGPGQFEFIDTNSRGKSPNLFSCRGDAEKIAAELFTSLGANQTHLPMSCKVLMSGHEDLSYVADDGTSKQISFDDLYRQEPIERLYPSKHDSRITAWELAVARCRDSLPNLVGRLKTIPVDKILSVLGALTMSETDDAVQLTEALLKAGLNVNMTKGQTPLHHACGVGNQKMVRLYLQYGADANSLDNSGATPLHRAIWRNDPVIIQALLDNGADCNIKAKNGLTPFETALAQNNFFMAEKLLEYTHIDENMLRDHSPLRNNWDKFSLEQKTSLLEQALSHYIHTRSNEPESWFGASKQNKIDAGEALLKKLQGDNSVDLTSHQGGLQNGRLRNIYNLSQSLLVDKDKLINTQSDMKAAIKQFKQDGDELENSSGNIPPPSV